MAKTATTKTPVEKIAAFDVARMTEDITGLIKRVSALHTEIAAIPPDKRTRSISTIESALRSTEAELQRIPAALGYAKDPESRKGQTAPKRSKGLLKKPPPKVRPAKQPASKASRPVASTPMLKAGKSVMGSPAADPTVKTGFTAQVVK